MNNTFKIKLETVDAVKAFSNAISKVDGQMDISHGRYVVDAKSIMGIFSLDLTNVLTLTVHTGDIGEVCAAVNDFLAE